jgi:hypothetical protein
MRKTLLMLLVCMLMQINAASATQNAGSAWNQYAEQYGFAPYPQSAAATFHDVYSGDNFEGDFGALISRVQRIMGTSAPELGGEDLINASLENWPGSSGT